MTELKAALTALLLKAGKTALFTLAVILLVLAVGVGVLHYLLFGTLWPWGVNKDGSAKDGSAKVQVEHYLFYGQSLSIGSKSVPVVDTPVTNSIFCLSGGGSRGGPRGTGTDLVPLKEEETANGRLGETPAAAFSHGLYNLMGKPGNYKLVVTTPGEGGQTVESLSSAQYFNRLSTVIQNAFNASKTKFAGEKLSVTSNVRGVFWVQGEADSKTRSEDYSNSVKGLMDKIKSVARTNSDQFGTFYVLSYQTASNSATTAAVQKAQFDMHRQGALGIVTPIYFFEFAKDQVHLTTESSRLLGAYFARAVKYRREGKKAPLLMPVKATCSEDTVVVEFDVPKQPIILETHGGHSRTPLAHHGFRVRGAEIISVTSSGNKVILKVNDCTFATTVRYALDDKDPNNITRGLGGCRDSTADEVDISTGKKILYNYAPHFEIDITKT